MADLSVNAAAINRGGGVRPEGLPDAIGDFALGVGSVQKQHVVVDIHADGEGIITKLLKTGAKVIGVDHRDTYGAAASASALGIAPRSVDIVFMDLALQHVQVPSLAILELKRILKPGGRLVVTDLEKDDRSGSRPAGFYPGDIRHWLKAAGFSNIIVNPVPAGSLRPGDGGPVGLTRTGYLMATGTA